MSSSETARLQDVPLRVTNPLQIPAKRYYDKDFFELEREKLWPHVWQMACRLEEIPEVGDWVEYRNLDKSVIVVRTKTGVKAFHNACRHRGVQLASGGRGNCEVQGFICPFHGWRWNIDGKNTFVFAPEIFDPESLDAAELNLVPCRIDFWAGCAFINFDNDAPGLRECLGPVAEKLEARNVDQLRMEWWYATELPTNWKLAMEAFMEGYHVMRTHPQLHVEMPAEMSRYGGETSVAATKGVADFVDKTLKFWATNGRGMAGMILESEVAIGEKLRDMALPDDMFAAAGAFYGAVRDEIYRDGLERGLPVADLNKAEAEHGVAYVEFMFPHYFLLPFFSAMSSYRVRPLTPETCLFEIWSLAPMATDDPRPRVTAPIFLPYDSPDYPEIPRQDYSNLPLQQLGLHATGFEYMRLSNTKEGMISNYQRLIDGYLAGLDPQKLGQAQRVVNSGFDAPVLDIGF
jgi:nitrite reductase/ring-hydroxylating ferredoxin subunit